MPFILTILTTLLLLSSAKAEEFKYKYIPENYKPLTNNQLLDAFNDEVREFRLLRSDSRTPHIIFNEGFEAQGKNENLLSHCLGGNVRLQNSNFISTSSNATFVMFWAYNKNKTTFIYVVNPQNNTYSMPKSLKEAKTAFNTRKPPYNSYTQEELRRVKQDLSTCQSYTTDEQQEEYDFKNKISSIDIKGAYKLERGSWSYIENPNYVNRPARRKEATLPLVLEDTCASKKIAPKPKAPPSKYTPPKKYTPPPKKIPPIPKKNKGSCPPPAPSPTTKRDIFAH